MTEIPAVLEVRWSAFGAASVIAAYAMLGGALLSAAITAPRNCKAVLDHVISPLMAITTFLVFLGAGVAPMLGWNTPRALLVLNLADWIAVAQIALLAIVLLCRSIVRRLLRDPETSGSGHKPN